MRQVIIIIIIIIITTMFMVLSSWQSHCESSPGSSDECRMAPSGRRPKTKPDDLGCESACTGCQKLHPPSPFIVGGRSGNGMDAPCWCRVTSRSDCQTLFSDWPARHQSCPTGSENVGCPCREVSRGSALCRLQRCSCLKIGCCC